jgi:hypothetical protein
MTQRIAALLCILILTAPAFAQPTPESRWADLVSPDEAKATRAMLALAASPKETIALLKERLQPVKADSKHVEQLVGQLKSSTFTVRNQAMAELEYLGKYIKADLEKAQKTNPDAETASRLKQLLDKMPKEQKTPAPMPLKARPGSNISITNNNGVVRILIDGVPLDLTPQVAPLPPGPSPLWVRAVRAVTVLEHFGTPEAQQILQTIAAGEADAMPTVAAQEALKRMKAEK